MPFLDDLFADQKKPQAQTHQAQAPQLQPAVERQTIGGGSFLDQLFPNQPKQRRLETAPLVKRGQDLLSQREADIDYTSGAPVPTRMMLQRASNPDEAKLVLERSYGPGNYGQDRFGQWWIRQNDKRISVLPKGVSGALQNVGTGMLSTPTATAGAVAGGVLGEIAFPAGGGIPGAMAGAALGTGIDDLVKWAQGVFAQKPKEVVQSMAGEAALAGLFQGAGPLVQRAGQGVRSFAQRFTGTTPATRQLGTELSASGAPPPVGSYAPEATNLEYKRVVRNKLSGDPQEAARVHYLERRMRGIFAQEGVPAPEIEQLMEQVSDRSFRVSTAQAGGQIAGAAQKIHGDLMRDYLQSRKFAEDALTKSDTLFRQLATPAATLPQDVSEAIITQRRNFSKQMAQTYKSIDRLTGDKPVVPTDMVKAQAKELVQVMPPNALPPLIKMWASKQAPAAMTFEQAHALRTTLREMSEIIDVSPTGQRTGNVRKMAGAVDQAISKSTDFTGQQAAKLLRDADHIYAEGIAKYNNASINKIVRDLRSGIVPEPEAVSRLIMQPENVNLAKTVMKMLPRDVQQGVIKADMKAMMDAASYRNDAGRRLMDGKSLLQAMDQRQALIREIYPSNISQPLRQYATELATFDGQIDASALKTPTALTYEMQKGVAAMRAAEEFAKNNPLGALTSNNPLQVDRALAMIARPGNEATTLQAAKTLGVNSPEWRAVRKYAMQRMFADSVVEKKPGVPLTISGPEINKQLSRFTAKQQEVMFPGGAADDLRTLAQEARFLFPSDVEHKEAGIVTIGGIKSKVPFNLIADWNWVRFHISGYLADRPWLVKFLAGEIQQNRMYARGLLSVMGQWIMDRAVFGGPGRGRPNPHVPPPALQPPPANTRDVSYGGPQE